jgi:hypothetical protein
MVYTYEMWDNDGKEVSVGLYETGSRPTTSGSDQHVPVEVEGRYYVLDADDILLKAHSFFRRKYGMPDGDDFYLRWASVLTFGRENEEALQQAGVVQVRNGEMVGIDANFVRMLLESYDPPELFGGFPTSPLYQGDSGFSLPLCLVAWKSGRFFKPLAHDEPDVPDTLAPNPEDSDDPEEPRITDTTRRPR